FAQVRDFLAAYGVPYKLVPTLVRGLDYYTRTTFEFRSEDLGAQDTICGGGRYDGLIEEIGGAAAPGRRFRGGGGGPAVSLPRGRGGAAAGPLLLTARAAGTPAD